MKKKINKKRELVSTLESYVELIKKNYRSHNREFSSIEEFVLKKGQVFKPDKCISGKPKCCFRNASLFAASDRDLIYVEGYILVCGFPILHAWVLDKNNKVIETTLEESASEYFGVKFNLEYVLQMSLLRGYYGVIDCPDLKFPLLTGKHKYLDYNDIKY